MKLNELIIMHRASRYAHAGDPGQVLPRVYGDFASTDAVYSDPAAGGMLPAVSIDTTNWVYCANDGPSLSVDAVYVGQQVQSPSVYVIDLANNYEGLGAITTIRFLVNPGGDPISWRGHGFVDGGGAPITNPILALRSHFLNAGASPWDRDYFHAPSVNRAAAVADANGYTMHWCFMTDQTYREILTDVLMHYHADFLLTATGEVAVFVDQPQGVSPDRLVRHLDVAADGTGDLPEDEVEWDLDYQNVCNELVLSYQYSWARGVYTASQTLRDEVSQAVYQSVRSRAISLPGVRTEAHVAAWGDLFFRRQALVPAVVRVGLRTLRSLPLLPSTYASISWRYGPSADGVGWQDRMVKVLNQTTRFEARAVDLEAFDTGLDWRPATYALLTDAASTTWYLWADDVGQWYLWATSPGVEAENLDPGYAWVRLISPDLTTYYVRPASATSWTVSTSQPGGTGTTAPVLVTSKNTQRWRLAINDAQEVFFIAEPRALAFGGQAWQTASFGRGRFDFHVFG